MTPRTNAQYKLAESFCNTNQLLFQLDIISVKTTNNNELLILNLTALRGDGILIPVLPKS